LVVFLKAFAQYGIGSSRIVVSQAFARRPHDR
jgi:hypothetical protein